MPSETRWPLALKRVKAQEDRITDAYISEAMELERYKTEMDRLRSHRKELDKAAKDIDRRTQQEADSHAALQQLERFCRRVAQGLDALTFDEQQQLLRLIVDRITLADGLARIETVIPTSGECDRLRTLRGEPVEP